VLRAASALLLSLLAGAASAADEQLFELAKKVANPLADLATAPALYNWDGRIGSDETGSSNYVRLQPVLPLHVDESWNVIMRLYMPVIEQQNVDPGSGTDFGLAGVNLSAFVSPRATVARDLTLGLGPVVGFPASESALGSEAWSLGPTGAIVWQPGPWTFGFLTRQLWSVAPAPGQATINEIYLQPFASYTTPDAWTFGINSESTYYWTDDEASVPINVTATKLFRLGGAALSVGPGVRYWVKNPDTGAHGWGFRFETTLVFPDDP
jgi:hypothetical protein